MLVVSLYKSLLPPTDRPETLPFPVTCVTITVPLPLSLLESYSSTALDPAYLCLQGVPYLSLSL